MTQQHFIPPELNVKAFNCPSCKAYAQQSWYSEYGCNEGNPMQYRQYTKITDVAFARCFHCDKESIWVGDRLVFPRTTQVAPPNSDLPENIKADYTEASLIVVDSPRGAAALLRLCIQKLCKHLGESGKNINDDIASLVKKGLSPKIQKSLDVVRVIGNEAVHPGSIDLNDQPETAIRLFELINIIAEIMISHPKMIDSIYKNLPEEKLSHIEKRDNRSK